MLPVIENVLQFARISDAVSTLFAVAKHILLTANVHQVSWAIQPAMEEKVASRHIQAVLMIANVQISNPVEDN